MADPLHEGAQRALMRLFVRAGRRQQAPAQYQRLRDALRRELEADPDPQTVDLYRVILRSQHPVEAAHEPSPPAFTRCMTSRFCFATPFLSALAEGSGSPAVA